MTESAEILTITATIPAGSTGTFTLDAEFVAAPDGSGTTYTPKVDSTPVINGYCTDAGKTASDKRSKRFASFSRIPFAHTAKAAAALIGRKLFLIPAMSAAGRIKPTAAHRKEYSGAETLSKSNA